MVLTVAPVVLHPGCCLPLPQFVCADWSLGMLQMGSRVRGTDSTATLIPVVKLAANMHGDERAGTEVLLRFAWDLCRRFAAKEESIVRLLGTTSIHILPSINPDGSARRQRFNARLKDLNREFPSLGLSRTYGVRSVSLPSRLVCTSLVSVVFLLLLFPCKFPSRASCR